VTENRRKQAITKTIEKKSRARQNMGEGQFLASFMEDCRYRSETTLQH
jgi:hypothetical protein